MRRIFAVIAATGLALGVGLAVAGPASAKPLRVESTTSEIDWT